MLVHICRRWRNLAFTSPRHLNLQLFYRTPTRSVKKMLEIWPELPVFVYNIDCQTKEARDDVAAALRLNHRVSGIRLEKILDSGWETFVSLMQRPFPVLRHLWVQPSILVKNPISRSFLSGSASCLRDLLLIGVPFPALPELLLSATNLVHLILDNIPPSGYISPQAMATGLSALTRLQVLFLSSGSPQDPPHTTIRIPPQCVRTLLPALTDLRFRGAPEYMEDLVAQIDAPLLENMIITLFRRKVLEVSELAKFVRRAEKLSLVDRVEITFKPACTFVGLSRESLLGRFYPKTLTLNLACRERHLGLSYLAQICASCLPTLSPFECLHIPSPIHFTWQDVIDDPDPQWLELLCLFNTVKHLRLSKPISFRVAQALSGLPAERVTEVLPALEIVFISGLEPFGPVKDAISHFADARQLSGHPVSICDWEGWGQGVHNIVYRGVGDG